MANREAFLPAYLSKENVPGLYRWLAPVYDLAGVVLGSKARNVGLDRARIQNGERVLELGVGTGLTFRQIVRRNPDGWNEGVDLTEAMLVRARRRMARTGFDNYRLVHGDAVRLPYDDNSFDCLISTYMFDLLSRAQMEEALTEWGRVLAPGGRLVLVYQTTGRRWYQEIWDTCYCCVPVILGGCRGIAPAPLVHEAGMEVESTEFISRLGIPQEVLVARPLASRP